MKKLITIFTLMILMFGCSSKNAEIESGSIDKEALNMAMEITPPSSISEKPLPPKQQDAPPHPLRTPLKR
jgi:hypothetical protein